MKILLLGEYSNVHATLAEGLRLLGHEVTVVSNGDFWKDYPRDVDVSRPSGKLGGLRLLARVYALLPRLRGYDVVQLINPMFLELKAHRLFPIYRYLRRHNRKVVLCAVGTDFYWVHECVTRQPLRYSDFNIGSTLRTDAPALEARTDWLGTDKEQLSRMIAQDCDAIVSGLYEYHVCYLPYYADKLQFIPLPIKSLTPSPSPKERGVVRLTGEEERDNTCCNLNQENIKQTDSPLEKSAQKLYTPLSLGEGSGVRLLRLFIGISRNRSAYKGTDIMLRAAEAVKEKYPDRLEIVKAEGVPFEQYQHLMDSSDVMMDQLYSYTPAMNALLAMSKGIVCIGGGEPENYDILGERELHPIINVQPSFDSVCHELELLVLHPKRLSLLKQQSIEYVSRHHDYLKVAAQYESLYKKLLFQ